MTEELLEHSPGKILTQAREQAGLSFRDVAEKLHLLPRQVEALEQDDYLQFSGDIFCKGYLKNYASLLGIDQEAIIAAYIRIRPPSLLNETAGTKKRNPHLQRPLKGKHLQYWCLIIFIVVLAILWLILGQEKTSNEVGMSAHDAVVVDKLEALAVAEPLSPNMPDKIKVIINSEASSVINTTNEVTKEETVKSINVVSEKNLSAVDDTLNFSFQSDCWLKVRDGDNNVIFADLKKAGETLQLTGITPFKILLGYARGVTLTHNTEPVSIQINQNDNSARFEVGVTL